MITVIFVDDVQSKGRKLAPSFQCKTSPATSPPHSEEKPQQDEKSPHSETNEDKINIQQSHQVETATNKQQDVGVNSNKTTDSKMAGYTESLKPSISGSSENVNQQPPLPRQPHYTNGISELSRSVSHDSSLKSIDPSQLKMPKAYSNNKGVTKERVLDSRGRRSPLTNAKDKPDAKPAPFYRGKYLSKKYILE